MKFKGVITNGAPSEIIDALRSEALARSILDEVMGKCLGAVNPTGRPGEYYVQMPDFTVNLGSIGVEVRLTGVSRGSRTPEQFERALTTMNTIVVDAVIAALREAVSKEKVQVFTCIMVDGDVPANEQYSSILELPAVWVSAEGIVPDDTQSE